MSIETYLIYLAALAAFFLTPPDTSQLLIISNSLRHGLKASTATIAGDLSANVLQMTAAAFGLAAIITASASALVWIKWLGVAYLAWIGLKLIFSKPEVKQENLQEKAAPKRQTATLFRQGFFTSSANPYAVVFFGALFPQFIDPALPVLPQLLILGTTYLIVDGCILVLWGWTAVRTVGRIQQLTGTWINRISGMLMVAAACLLASKDLGVEKN